MSDDVRTRVAKRIASEKTELPTSGLGRRARLLGGLAQASAKSVGRSLRRVAGREAPDIEPEVEVAASFGRLKGTVTKMGQMLGYVDVGLPDTLRSALAALHTTAQPLDRAWVERVLDEDLGDPGRALARAMAKEPLSVGSVGQVHRSSLPDGTPVAVKVLHPGLATIIDRDFAPAMFASRVSSAVHDAVERVRARLLEECDYVLEARRQARFAEIFAGHDTIVIPAVHHDLCSARVLTTTFVEGVHLDAYLAARPSREAKNRAGEALFDAYAAPLFRHGLYVCDAHPGNYLFMPDGRVAVVDFGCAREFEAGFVERLAALTRAVMDADRTRIHRALVDLGVDERAAYDRDAIVTLLRSFYGPLLRDEELAFDLRAEVELGKAVRAAWKARRVALSAEVFFLLRTFLGLSSVLARLDARSRWRRRLEAVVRDAPPAARASEPASDAPSVPKRSPDRAAGATSPSVRPGSWPPPPRPERWDVVLVDAGESPIALIRELRALFEKDLREVRDFVESLPQTLAHAMPRREAEALRQRFEGAGARVEVRRVSRSA